MERPPGVEDMGCPNLRGGIATAVRVARRDVCVNLSSPAVNLSMGYQITRYFTKKCLERAPRFDRMVAVGSLPKGVAFAPELEGALFRGPILQQSARKGASYEKEDVVVSSRVQHGGFDGDGDGRNA
jgi:hypothetical protein